MKGKNSRGEVCSSVVSLCITVSIASRFISSIVICASLLHSGSDLIDVLTCVSTCVVRCVQVRVYCAPSTRSVSSLATAPSEVDVSAFMRHATVCTLVSSRHVTSRDVVHSRPHVNHLSMTLLVPVMS